MPELEEMPELSALTGGGNVVVGVDGSRAGQRAVHYAVGIARRTATRLVVVHVRHTWVTYDGIGPQGVVDEGRLDPEARAEIERAVEECGVAAVYLDVPATGGTASVLARVAGIIRADVVVVGASTHPLHRVAGAVGAQLIKCCACPVTVVP